MTRLSSGWLQLLVPTTALFRANILEDSLMRVVGMDVHVRNSFLCVTEGDGQLLRRGRVGNSLSELAEFLGSLPGGDQPLKVVLESGLKGT